MSSLITDYVSEFGEEAIFDTEKLKDYFIKNDALPSYMYQILLVIEGSGFKDVIERNEERLSSVVLNSLFINCMESTKLSANIIKTRLAEILDAMKISYNYEVFVLHEDYESNNSNALPIEAAWISLQEQDAMWDKAKLAASAGRYDEAYQMFFKLSKAGNAQAMNQIGLFYFNGWGTEKDPQKALIWFENAAKNGCVEAVKFIGDYYYENDDILTRSFAKAYKCYTSPGVISYDTTVKTRIVNIINQKQTNIISLLLGGFALIFMWIFTFSFHSCVHSGSNVIALGVILSVIVTLIYALAWYVFKLFKYNNIKYLLPIITVLWAIYPFVLAIG